MTSTLTWRGLRSSETKPCMDDLVMSGQLPGRTRSGGGDLALGTALLRVQLDDQVLVDIREDLLAARLGLEGALQALLIDFEPFREADLRGDRERLGDARLGLRLVADGDDVALRHLVRRDVDRLAVDQDRLVAD